MLKKKQKSRNSKGLVADAMKTRIRENLAPNFPSISSNSANQSGETYSTSYLNELRNSTPATPAEFTKLSKDNSQKLVEDVEFTDGEALFEVNAEMAEDIDVPDEAFISHMIEKRRQKAEAVYTDSTTEAFISLEEDASDDGISKMEGVEMDDESSMKSSNKSRLQREDDVPDNEFEDIAEGDGRIPLSAAQEFQQREQRRRDIKEMIDDHEDEQPEAGDDYLYMGTASSDSEDDWEQAQLMKGAFGKKSSDDHSVHVKQQDAETKFMVLQALPDFDSVIKRLALTLDKMKQHRDESLKSLEELNLERERIEARKKEVKDALDNQTLEL